MFNGQLTSSQIGKNKTVYYKNGKKDKLVYKTERVEVVTYFTGIKQKERVHKIEITVRKKDGLLKRTTNYFMERRVCSIIDAGFYNTYIKYDNVEGKNIIALEKRIQNNDENAPESKELHYYAYKNSHLIKEQIKYYGKYLKSGIGERNIEYDFNGNVISNKDNIEDYNEKLNKKLKYKIFPIFNEELKNRFPKLPQTNEHTFGLNDIKRMLTKSLNITLDSGSLLKEYYEQNDDYELPFMFASAAYNTLAQKNNAYIKTETPEIFYDVDEKELYEKLDILSLYQRNRSDFLPVNSIIKLKLGNKIFDCISIGKGWEGSAYRISYQNRKPVILKIYHAENKYHSFSLVSFEPSGLYGSLAILREANFAKVEDIAKLYYANPIYTPIGFDGREIKYIGAWQIFEDALSRNKREEGLKFRDWIKSHGLVWNDDKLRNWVNGICIDPGYVQTLKPRAFLNDETKNEINLIYSRYINRETTREILDFLNNNIANKKSGSII